MLTTLDTFDTDYSADSAEWCPAEGFQDLLVCGTYQLVPGEEDGSLAPSVNGQKRLGRIHLLRVIQNGALHLLNTLNTAAVFDMKWAHANLRGDALLGVVNSIGFLQIYKLDKENEPTLKLVTETRVQENEKEILALSLDWNTGRFSSDSENEVQIAVSDSKGSVSLYNFTGAKLELVACKKLHDFEAWITAFDYWSPNTVYSGGDDCKFHRLDARMGLEPVGVNRLHGAGVTSLHSNAAKEFSLASGSYDEILRIWDTRKFRSPLSETNLGDGIWRLKWDPFNHDYLLAACMYGGFRVIDGKEQSKPRIVEEYNEHESIAYGCDWSLLPDSVISSKIIEKTSKSFALVATCSFYDHTLKLSSLSLPGR